MSRLRPEPRSVRTDMSIVSKPPGAHCDHKPGRRDAGLWKVHPATKRISSARSGMVAVLPHAAPGGANGPWCGRFDRHVGRSRNASANERPLARPVQELLEHSCLPSQVNRPPYQSLDHVSRSLLPFLPQSFHHPTHPFDALARVLIRAAAFEGDHAVPADLAQILHAGADVVRVDASTDIDL